MGTGGLPTFKELGRKVGAGKDVIQFFEKFSPLETMGADFLAELFPPPDPIEFPEVKPATPPPTISEVQEAGDEARKRSLRGRGRRGTFLTGDVTPDLTPATGKKPLLG